jgi:streptogramin lyase
MRRELKRHHGREIDTAGDGFFATFDQPTDAIECAEAMIRELRAIDVDIRAGVHMGEVELTGANVSGIAVHVGARVMSKAGAGEVFVSSTVRELMTGSDLEFHDLGFHALKGVEHEMHLFAVRPPVMDAAEPAPSEPEGPSGRRPLVAAAAVVAVLLVVVAVVATRPRSGADAFVPAVNTVAELDPASGDVIGGVHVGTTPTVVAYGDGGLWVANLDDKTIQRIDVETQTAGAAQGGVLSNPTGLALGDARVWVTNGFAGQLVVFDPSEPNDVVPIDVGSGAAGVAFGFDHVWVCDSVAGSLLRVDPVTDDIERIALPHGSSPVDVAIGTDRVWVADSVGARVFSIDPDSLEIDRTVSLLNADPARIASGAGSIWVTSTLANSLTRIDPSSGGTTTVAHVGNGPLGVAASADGVWVANSRDGTVTEVDPRAATVKARYHVGFSPDSVAITPSGIWVSLHAP